MATAKRNVEVLISAKDKASRVLSGFGKGLIAVGAAVAGAVVAFRTFSRVVGKVIEVSNAQQKADLDLARALSTVGENTEEARKRFKDLANELQDTTTVSNDLIQGITGTIASLGNLSGDALEEATRATLDFAAALNQDAQAAAINIAKAAGGYVSVLTRYGIVIDTSKSKTEQFNQALDEVKKKFGGAAEIAGKTFAGSIARAKNDLDDFLKVIGVSLTESTAFKEAFDAVSASIKSFGETIEKNRDSIDEFVLVFANGLVLVGKAALFLSQTLLAASTGLQAMVLVVRFASREDFAALGQQFKSIAEAIRQSDLALQGLDTALADIEKKNRAARGTAEDLSKEFENQKEVINELDEIAKQSVEAFKTLGVSIDNFTAKKDAIIFVRDSFQQFAEAAGLSAAKFNLVQEAAEKANAELFAVGEAVEGFGKELEQTGPDLGIFSQSLEKMSADIAAAGFALDELNLKRAFEEAGPPLLTTFDLIKQSGEATAELEENAIDVSNVLGQQAVAAVGQFSNVLVDAAAGGEVAFDKFIKSILVGLARAIVRALLLKALVASTGGAGGFFGALLGQSGGKVSGAQTGGLVRGPLSLGDTVPALLQPGEIILPKSLAADFSALAQVARSVKDVATQQSLVGGGAQFQMFNTFEGIRDEEQAIQIIEVINDAVERRGVQLTASSILS